MHLLKSRRRKLLREKLLRVIHQALPILRRVRDAPGLEQLRDRQMQRPLVIDISPDRNPLHAASSSVAARGVAADVRRLTSAGPSGDPFGSEPPYVGCY